VTRIPGWPGPCFLLSPPALPSCFFPNPTSCVLSHLQPYWNQDVSQYFIIGGNYTQTGNLCDLPNCTSWSQGSWPTIGNGPVNGGVPQNGNLTQHLELLAKNVVKWIPDPEYDGNAVFDFENWTPVWEENWVPGGGWHGVEYQDYSITLMQQQHPTWPAADIEAAAKASFEAAAVEWFVESLYTARFVLS
jgi:hypothetical protein